MTEGVVVGGWASSRVGPIGIDFGSNTVKIVQLRMKGVKTSIVGAAQFKLPHDFLASNSPVETVGEFNVVESQNSHRRDHANELAHRLRSAIIVGGFVRNRCVISIPRAELHTQHLRMPRMPDEDLRHAVGWEAAARFDFARHELEADCVRCETPLHPDFESPHRDDVVLVAASHNSLNRCLEPILAAGLYPTAVDAGFTALARTFTRRFRRQADRSVVQVIVEVGYEGSTVLILRGDRIASFKSIAIGGKHFNDAISGSLQLDSSTAAEIRMNRLLAHHAANPTALRDESTLSDKLAGENGSNGETDRAIYETVRPLLGDLAREVMLCLKFYNVRFRGRKPERIILTGGDGLEPKLNHIISKACKLQVVFDPGDSSNFQLHDLADQIGTHLNRSAGPAGCWVVPIGLALQGLDGQRDESVARSHVPEVANRIARTTESVEA